MRRSQKPEKHSERRCLAGTIWAKQAVHLPLPDMKAEMINRDDGVGSGTERLREIADVDHKRFPILHDQWRPTQFYCKCGFSSFVQIA